MSIEAISWVIKQDIPDGVAKLVAMVLADYADRHTGAAHPKIRQLAEACSQSERSVQRKLRVLQDLDVLTIQLGHCPRSGRQRANSYILHLPSVDVPGRGEPGARGDRFDVGSVEPGARGDSGTPQIRGEGCSRVTGEGDSVVTGEGDSPVTPVENPSDSTVRTESPQPPGAGGRRGGSKLFRGNSGAAPVRLAADPGAGPPDGLTSAARERFERLWAAYPPDGLGYSDRAAAERLFAALAEADQALAVTAAAGYRTQLARFEGGKPIRAKALQGWLRQRRFVNLRPAAPAEAPASRVFVRDGSPGWAAWMAHERAQGRPTRTPTWSAAERAEGWWFPSALPPAVAAGASA